MAIKTAFLQGETFDRHVYLYLSPEANVAEGYFWKLSKCVHIDCQMSFIHGT